MEGLRDDSSFLGPGQHSLPPTLCAPEVSCVPRLARERVNWEVHCETARLLLQQPLIRSSSREKIQQGKKEALSVWALILLS